MGKTILRYSVGKQIFSRLSCSSYENVERIDNLVSTQTIF